MRVLLRVLLRGAHCRLAIVLCGLGRQVVEDLRFVRCGVRSLRRPRRRRFLLGEYMIFPAIVRRSETQNSQTSRAGVDGQCAQDVERSLVRFLGEEKVTKVTRRNRITDQFDDLLHSHVSICRQLYSPLRTSLPKRDPENVVLQSKLHLERREEQRLVELDKPQEFVTRKIGNFRIIEKAMQVSLSSVREGVRSRQERISSTYWTRFGLTLASFP